MKCTACGETISQPKNHTCAKAHLKTVVVEIILTIDDSDQVREDIGYKVNEFLAILEEVPGIKHIYNPIQARTID